MYLDMRLKTLYFFGLLILPYIILGQGINEGIPITSNGMEKLLMPKSLLKECYSGPIVWSNCRDKGPYKFPMVSQLKIKFELYTTSNRAKSFVSQYKK